MGLLQLALHILRHQEVGVKAGVEQQLYVDEPVVVGGDEEQQGKPSKDVKPKAQHNVVPQALVEVADEETLPVKRSQGGDRHIEQQDDQKNVIETLKYRVLSIN